MLDLVFAHPYPDRSRANRALLTAAREVPGVGVRSLYDLYPDLAIDVAAEQEALAAAHTVIWHHPLYWYTAPALLKLWFEKVLSLGFAYGPGGDALRGKRCLWVVTAGGDEEDYSAGGVHEHALSAFAPVIRQTARFCGMEWLEPLVVLGAPALAEADLTAAAERYRARLQALCEEDPAHA